MKEQNDHQVEHDNQLNRYFDSEDEGCPAFDEPEPACKCPYCGAPLMDRLSYSAHLVEGCGVRLK